MVEYRKLGNTGLNTAPISLGTVALGVNYGIESSIGESMPSTDEAINLIKFAVNSGIIFFDTAPNYGLAEERVGIALQDNLDSYIATKVSIPIDQNQIALTGQKARNIIFASLHNSLKQLNRETLDLVQIHNATAELLTNGNITEHLIEAQKQGIIKHLGVSVYGEAAAVVAIESGVYKTIQIAYNLIDRTMEQVVLPMALEKGIGVIVRSVFLKGALSEKVLELPDELRLLRSTVVKMKEDLKLTWEQVPELAIRFCLSHPAVSTVLIGARTSMELSQAMKAAGKGPLDNNEKEVLKRYSIDDERLTNPSYWNLE